jgi:hypothetical protein
MVCPSQNLLKTGTGVGGGDTRTMIETKDLYFSHPRECSVYIGCDEFGNMSVLECLNGTHFSPYYQSCVHASIAQCKKYPTIDQTPINISLRLLIMNNSLRNFDLELFNNSNETILEENYMGSTSESDETFYDATSLSSSSSSPPTSTTTASENNAAEIVENETEDENRSSIFIVESRALTSNNNDTLLTTLNSSNITQF